MKESIEKNLESARVLFQASLTKIFSEKKTWAWNSIGNVFKTGSGGTPSKLHKEYYDGGTIPWLRSGEVCQKYIDKTEMFITESGLLNSSAKWFPKNTVLVAMYGATAGQVGILKTESTTNQAICGILPNKQFTPEFLYYCLINAQKSLVAKATGNAQPNISQIKVKETLVPIIGIDEQKSIISLLERLDDKCQALERSFTKTISLCGVLKKALLRKFLVSYV